MLFCALVAASFVTPFIDGGRGESTVTICDTPMEHGPLFDLDTVYHCIQFYNGTDQALFLIVDGQGAGIILPNDVVVWSDVRTYTCCGWGKSRMLSASMETIFGTEIAQASLRVYHPFR